MYSGTVSDTGSVLLPVCVVANPMSGSHLEITNDVDADGETLFICDCCLPAFVAAV